MVKTGPALHQNGTGPAFFDYISSGKSKVRRSFDFKSNPMRDLFLLISLIFVIGVLVIKLIQLQILEGSNFFDLSNNNRIRTVIVHAPRGAILDRNGKPLVFNIPGFRKKVNGKTILIGKNDAISLLAAGESLEYDSLRQYPYKEVFSHVLGYIGQISEEELKNPKFAALRGGDLIGKMGIEASYERILRGKSGKQLVEVTASLKTVRKLGQTDPVLGQDITLTLDLELQKAAFEAMKNVKKGAVIVSTQKGEILVLVSKPSFDPNLFALPTTYQEAAASSYLTLSDVLEDSENQPLLNRAISGVYPPGSTFKLVVAAAGLENKIINEDFTVEDVGSFSIGPFSFSNWYFSQYGKTEGSVDIVKGIKRSNDIFFYKLAEKVGVDKIGKTAFEFGLGKKLGIDLANEEEGVVPTPLWKKEAIGEPWYLGDTYHYGIGQGYVLATPLQVNAWTQVIANGGTLYQPRLVKNEKLKIKNEKFLSDKTVSLVRQGMVESCSPGGVAWPLFKFRVQNEKLKIDGRNFLTVPESTQSASLKDYKEVTIACKTGTAQHGGAEDIPHAWITLFAPAYDPQIVVTVLAESSGEGSNVAAPIAKKILEEWFGR